jgi:2-polyprenyl-3-methyl-5-hydroxy-6-metoxy-1,4-benzoquinol methylase
MRCRFCNQNLEHTFVDLGMSPLCESYVPAERLGRGEVFYPLHVFVCSACFLVQLDEFVPVSEIFAEYAYFSSFADSWVEHARRYAHMAAARFQLNATSLVVEVASNDGYLLQHFLPMGIPVLGIEPAANIARAAESRGVRTLVKFFTKALAEELATSGGQADLIVGNNVLAQVPQLNDFVAGLKTLLKPDGVVTLEFPHLQRLIEGNQFDTIYHEHFSYFSLLAAEKIFTGHGLLLFDVEELPTHGGSLRVYLCHQGHHRMQPTPAVAQLRESEQAFGLDRLGCYARFRENVEETKRRILSLLVDLRRQGKRIAGYGAPGKGNTLLNYCGIRTDFLDYTVDRNPYKQGKFLPGTRIPIFAPEKILETRPDYVFILPWNFQAEIMAQMSRIREWGGQFIVPIPSPTVVK